MADEGNGRRTFASEPGVLRGAAIGATRVLVVGFAVWGAAWVFANLTVVFVPVILAVFVTTLLGPPAGWLRHHRVPSALATTAVFVGGLAVVGGAVYLLIPQAADSIEALSSSIERAVKQLRGFVQGLGFSGLNELLDRILQEIRQRSDQLVSGAITGAAVAAEVVTGLVLTIVLAVYFVYDGAVLWQDVLRLAPARYRRPLREGAHTGWEVISRYIRGMALVGLVDAVLFGLALWLLGVPLVIPLAVLTFLGAFLPLIGAILTGLLAALVALVANGWFTALLVVAAALAVQQLEGHVVAPQVYGKVLKLHPVMILLAITTGTVIAGILGAFLATPVTAVVVALLRDNIPADDETEPGGQDG